MLWISKVKHVILRGMYHFQQGYNNSSSLTKLTSQTKEVNEKGKKR